MNIHQTLAHGKFLASIGWKISKHRYHNTDTYYFLRKMPGLPIHFLKIQRIPLNLIDWNWVRKIEKEYNVVETVIEIDKGGPQPFYVTELTDQGYHPAKDFMLTTKTRLIDIDKTELQLIEAMKPKTRYNLKKSQKNGLSSQVLSLDKVVNSKIIREKYFRLLKDNSRRIGMLLLPKKWIFKQWEAFENNGFAVEIKRGEETVALALFYVSKDTCSYNLNGSTAVGRKLFAPTLAVWQGIREGKRRRLSNFDFDGVFDERYGSLQKRFAGFGKFKSGFGGNEVYFPPMYRKKDYKRLFDLIRAAL